MSLYVLNVLASRDLIEIADYFAETNVEVSERFFKSKLSIDYLLRESQQFQCLKFDRWR